MAANQALQARDFARAAPLLSRVCDAGELGACVQLADLLDHGPGPTRSLSATAAADPPLLPARAPSAVQQYRYGPRHTDKNGASAPSLRGERASRTGTSEDATRARDLYGRACAGGMQQACDELGH